MASRNLAQWIVVFPRLSRRGPIEAFAGVGTGAALALDLMEEFRTPVVDSAVITAINTGMVRDSDFEIAKAGCAMKPAARKAFIRAYESRLEQLVTHPIFDYRCSWRTIIRLQAKLLARWVRREIESYVGMETR